MRHFYLKLTGSVILIVSIAVSSVYADSIIDISSTKLIDEQGQAAVISDYDGAYRLVFFGYTYCPDICPMTLFYIATALKSLGPLVEQLKVLFISVDPKRDTPQALIRYTDAFHPSIIGMTGSYDQIVAATKGFRTTFGFNMEIDGKERTLTRKEYEDISSDASYVPYHSSQIYILDPKGALVDIIGYGSTPDLIASKLREYLTE